MNVKIAAVLLVCAVMSAEARPKPQPPAGKAGDKGKDSKPDLVNLTVEGLKKLCEGLSSGNITNTNSSYNDVFTSLGDVCADVATYLAAQAAPTPAPVQDPAAGGARRKRGARPDRKGPGANHSEESSEVDDDENKALAMLFRICKGLEQLQANLPADLAADLVNIFTKMGTVCTAADLVRNPVAPAVPA